MSKKPKIFISYSHENKNEDWKDFIRKFFESSNSFKMWDDRDIPLGEKWLDKIEKALVECDIAILLISIEFLNSQFIKDKEIPIFLKRCEEENLKIVPIIISPCQWKRHDWLKSIQGYPKDNKPLNSFQEILHNKFDECPKIQEEVNKLIDRILEEYEDKWKEMSKSSIQPILQGLDFAKSDETTKIKSYFNIDADKQKLFITTARQFFPVNYYKSMPKEVNDLIDELLKIGQRINSTCVPILCILNEICDQEYSPDIVDYIEYLKSNKFKNYTTCDCKKNIFDTTITFQILFNYMEDGTYSIEAWKYENKTSEKISKWIDLDTQKVDLSDVNKIKEVVDKLEENIENIDYEDILYVELILPVESLYDNNIYKGWKELFASYYSLFRIDSRFRKVDNKLKKKWNRLNIDENSDCILNDSSEKLRIYKYTKDSTYKKELTAQSLSVVLEKKIDNSDLLFKDIKKFGVPIVLSSLSESKITSEIIGEELKEITIKECRAKICVHIMDNSCDEESDILFIMDNPESIPDINKNPEQNLYG